MSVLPGRPDLDQLRRQARELLRAAAANDDAALRRIRAVSQKQTLSVAQLAIAREYGFASWPELRGEVLRRQGARGGAGAGIAAPLVDDAEGLIDKQYADRSRLRPVFDTVIRSLGALPGPVTVQARGTLVSLVSPRRTFAVLKPTTKSRIDLGLRLDSTRPAGRLREAKNLGQATVRIPLTTSGDVDDEVRHWLARAYDENTAPPTAEQKRPAARPKPVLGTLSIVIEGTELPGLSCQPEPDGTVHRDIHVALSTKARGIAEGQPWLTVPLKPGLAVNPFPGDARQTRWQVTVTVRGSAEDGYDFTGPAVAGDRTDRSLGLVWGEMPGDGTLHMFRGAKLRLADVPPGLIAEAMRPGHHLVAHVRLTDDKGNPVCARVRPSHLTWSAEPS